MKGLKYSIAGKEYTPASLIRLANDFGGNIKPNSIARIHETLMNAVKYLREKGVWVKVLLDDGNELLITDSPKSSVKDKTKQNNKQDIKQIEFKPEEGCMVVLFDDGVYEINPAFLSDECWDVQLFGNPGCQRCEDKNKIMCDGQDVLKNGQNSMGNQIPLAKRIADRPRREGKG